MVDEDGFRQVKSKWVKKQSMAAPKQAAETVQPSIRDSEATVGQII